MLRHLAAGLLPLILSASVAAAQDASSSAGSGSGFCATAPQDLLVALNGSWTLTQAAGGMMGASPGRAGGTIAVPLPPQPPVTMQLEYHPALGLTIMSGQGQEMALIPTFAAVDELPELVGSWFGDHLDPTSASGCDWYALPTILGTTTYDLEGEYEIPVDPELQTINIRTYGRYLRLLCFGGEAYLPNKLSDGWGDDLIDLVQSGRDGYSKVPRLRERCVELIGGEGKMTMAIAVKFDSPSSGRGVVAFDGKMEGSVFSGGAPITMSR